jgi:hypothetical protein
MCPSLFIEDSVLAYSLNRSYTECQLHSKLLHRFTLGESCSTILSKWMVWYGCTPYGYPCSVVLDVHLTSLTNVDLDDVSVDVDSMSSIITSWELKFWGRSSESGRKGTWTWSIRKHIHRKLALSLRNVLILQALFLERKIMGIITDNCELFL